MPVDLLDGMGVVEAAQQTVSDWVALHNQVHHALLHAQASQKRYADARCRDVNYNVLDLVLLATKNLHLQGPRKLQDRFIGPFKCIVLKVNVETKGPRWSGGVGTGTM